MEKLTCIMDCKKETQPVRKLRKIALSFFIWSLLLALIGSLLSIAIITEFDIDSIPVIISIFITTFLLCSFLSLIGEMLMAFSHILQELTTNTRIAELRASLDGVPYYDDNSNNTPYYRRSSSTNSTANSLTGTEATSFEVGAPGWICPKCGERSIGGFCKKCGEKSPYAKAESTKIKAGTWKCPNCGKTYMNSVSRCSCGFEKES